MAEFKNSDAVDDVHPGSQQGRKRRQKKLLPKPLLRLIVALVAIIVVVVVIVVAVTSTRGSGEAADYQRYMTSVADHPQAVGRHRRRLTKLLTNPGDTNRKEIQTKLDQFVAKSAQLEKRPRSSRLPRT